MLAQFLNWCHDSVHLGTLCIGIGTVILLLLLPAAIFKTYKEIINAIGLIFCIGFLLVEMFTGGVIGDSPGDGDTGGIVMFSIIGIIFIAIGVVILCSRGVQLM